MTSLRLVIDNREPDTVFRAFDNLEGDNGLKIGRANLEYGDFLISRSEEEQPLMVIERKSLADLLASVDDGRYRQQKKALLERYNRSRIYYIIETGVWLNGFYNVDTSAPSYDHIKRETTIGCIIGMMVRDDIKIFFTRDLEDTIGLVKGLLKRFMKNYDKYFGGGDGSTDTCNVDLTKKRVPSGKTNVFTSMLMMIPGVSEKTAATIASAYKGFKELREAIVSYGGTGKFRDVMLINGRRMAEKTVEAIWNVANS